MRNLAGHEGVVASRGALLRRVTWCAATTAACAVAACSLLGESDPEPGPKACPFTATQVQCALADNCEAYVCNVSSPTRCFTSPTQADEECAKDGVACAMCGNANDVSGSYVGRFQGFCGSTPISPNDLAFTVDRNGRLVCTAPGGGGGTVQPNGDATFTCTYRGTTLTFGPKVTGGDFSSQPSSTAAVDGLAAGALPRTSSTGDCTGTWSASTH